MSTKSNKKFIAIAGGTSPTLGTAIVNALTTSSTCAPVILSRLKPGESQPPSKSTLNGTSVPIRYVDYQSIESLKDALQDVHTVISVLKIPGPEMSTYQLNLVEAAKQAGVKRFAPSEFEYGAVAEGRADVLGLKVPVWNACKGSGLEVARFHNGGFMNLLLLGADRNPRFEDKKERIEEGLHGLVDDPIFWDMLAETAEEVEGDPRVTLTEIGDIGRFVAAACELEDGKWEREMNIVGETLRISEITKMIEDISGIEFKRTKVTLGDLKEREAAVEGIGTTREEIIGKLHAQLTMVMMEDKQDAAWLRPVVNDLCPAVKPTGLREYLQKCFK